MQVYDKTHLATLNIIIFNINRKQTDGTSAVFDESLIESDNGNSYRVHDVSFDDICVNYDPVKVPMDLPQRPQSAIPAVSYSKLYEIFI